MLKIDTAILIRLHSHTRVLAFTFPSPLFPSPRVESLAQAFPLPSLFLRSVTCNYICPSASVPIGSIEASAHLSVLYLKASCSRMESRDSFRAVHLSSLSIKLWIMSRFCNLEMILARFCESCNCKRAPILRIPNLLLGRNPVLDCGTQFHYRFPRRELRYCNFYSRCVAEERRWEEGEGT